MVFVVGCRAGDKGKPAETSSPPAFDQCEPVAGGFQTLPTGGWKEILDDFDGNGFLALTSRGVLVLGSSPQGAHCLLLGPTSNKTLTLDSGPPLGLATLSGQRGDYVALVDRVSSGQARLRLAVLKEDELTRGLRLPPFLIKTRSLPWELLLVKRLCIGVSLPKSRNTPLSRAARESTMLSACALPVVLP